MKTECTLHGNPKPVIGEDGICWRCKAEKLTIRLMWAEKYIEESPCDPDITQKQHEAYRKWQEQKRDMEYLKST